MKKATSVVRAFLYQANVCETEFTCLGRLIGTNHHRDGLTTNNDKNGGGGGDELALEYPVSGGDRFLLALVGNAKDPPDTNYAVQVDFELTPTPAPSDAARWTCYLWFSLTLLVVMAYYYV